MKWGLAALAVVLVLPVTVAEDFLAVAHDTTPFVTIYRQDGDVFTKLSNPSSLPAGIGTDVDFSPNQQFMAVSHATTPFVTIYSISGTTFTKLADPANLPTGTAIGLAFSPDGQFLAVAHATTPFVTIYSISGTTFTKLANPATLPSEQGNGLCFDSETDFLAVTHSVSPFVTIYSISGTTFTKLADPATLPAGQGGDCDFTDDGSMLAVAHSTTPFVTIYSISGTTFTKLADPATLPTGQGLGADFSEDGAMLAVGHAVTPFVTLYDVDGSTFTKRANPTTLPASTARKLEFNGDSSLLAVPHDTTPRVTIYAVTGASFIKQENPATLPTGDGNGAAFMSSVTDATRIFCADPDLVRFGYNFNEGWNHQTGNLLLDETFHSSATSDNRDYLGLGLDYTSRAYEVEFSINTASDGRTSIFKAVFSLENLIPSVGNKGNAINTGMSENSVRVTFQEDGSDWDVELHSVVDGTSTEDADTTIGDDPNLNPTTSINSFRFVVDTRAGTEEYRIERYDGAVILNAAIPAAHIDSFIGSQWFVHQGGGATLNAAMSLDDTDETLTGTGVSTCLTDLEGVSSVDAPEPGAPGGQGGSDGGTIGDQPFFPGVDTTQLAVGTGMSLDQVGWLIGILLIIAMTAALAVLGAWGAVVGGIAGLGMSVAFGLIPVWFLVFVIILAVGGIVYLRRG